MDISPGSGGIDPDRPRPPTGAPYAREVNLIMPPELEDLFRAQLRDHPAINAW